MKNLIEIREENGKKLVGARELYVGLGLSKSEWSKWYKRNILANEYFEENTDWIGFGVMTNGNKTMDFAITLEFAKHIAMMARTKKSHEYRNYFIECEKQVKEISSYMIEDPIERAKAWIVEQEEKNILKQNIEAQKEIIKEYKPKVDVYNRVLDSKGLIKISTIAQDYGMSAIELNKLLHKLGIQYKKGDQWFLYAKYKDMGYTKSDYTEIPHRDGTISTKATTKWTPKGRLFIDEILKGIGISSVFINKSYQQIAF